MMAKRKPSKNGKPAVRSSNGDLLLKVRQLPTTAALLADWERTAADLVSRSRKPAVVKHAREVLGTIRNLRAAEKLATSNRGAANRLGMIYAALGGLMFELAALRGMTAFRADAKRQQSHDEHYDTTAKHERLLAECERLYANRHRLGLKNKTRLVEAAAKNTGIPLRTSWNHVPKKSYCQF